MAYLFKNYNGLKVAYLPKLDGGGSETYKEFIVIVKKTIGKVDRICEFCAGPSFIGFSLLAEGLCNSLCLVDINPEAIKAIQETIKLNNLQDKVTVYQSDGLSNVPKTEKWDLVVSNPPHFHAKTQEEYKQNIILKDFKLIYYYEELLLLLMVTYQKELFKHHFHFLFLYPLLLNLIFHEKKEIDSELNKLYMF